MVTPYQVIVETLEQPREYVFSDEPDRASADRRVWEILADPPVGVTNAYTLRRHY